MIGTAKPNPSASCERTSGASCEGSPTKTTLWHRTKGIQLEGSVACAASSNTNKSNAGSFWTFSAPAPTVVQSTTCACCSTSRSAAARVLRPLTAIPRCSLRSSLSFSSRAFLLIFAPPFPEPPRAASRASNPTFAASASSRLRWSRDRSKYPAVLSRTFCSSEFLCAASEMRSGAPILTKEIELIPTPASRSESATAARRSTRLSTAALEGAHARTRSPLRTARLIISITTLVLPVPGGPWIQHTGVFLESAARTASRCWSSNASG
mmetsp:Transcript_3728/g.13799  ORF Transcript_3728/g.13799 Transcript_3728/m.13799 type:complete len:267 (-) Transcript_3728:861-1661(-)